MRNTINEFTMISFAKDCEKECDNFDNETIIDGTNCNNAIKTIEGIIVDEENNIVNLKNQQNACLQYINENNSKKSELESQKNLLINELNSLSNSLSYCQNNDDNQNSYRQNTESQISSIKSEIDSIEGKIQRCDQNIGGLNEISTRISGDISIRERNISQLKTSISSLNYSYGYYLKNMGHLEDSLKETIEKIYKCASLINQYGETVSRISYYDSKIKYSVDNSIEVTSNVLLDESKSLKKANNINTICLDEIKKVLNSYTSLIHDNVSKETKIIMDQCINKMKSINECLDKYSSVLNNASNIISEYEKVF